MKIRSRTLIPALLAFPLTITAGTLAADELAERERAARQASGEFVKQLGAALKKALTEGGPEAAISVCRDIAPQITGKMSRDNGWRMTRVSSKVRNPLLGMPDAWEQKVLADFELRAGQGETYPDMLFSEVVDESGVRYYRFMKPIPTQPLCLTCHGSDESVPEGVKAKLASDYPMDRARGYRVGELRGAVSIKQPMAIPLP
jgi:hypothetical protein